MTRYCERWSDNSTLERRFSPVASYLAAALFAAQRFFVAAIILARPAALSFRLGFFADAGSDDSAFDAAHRFRCASPMALRAAALIFRRGCLAAGSDAD